MPLLEHFPLSLLQYIYLFRINLPIRHTYTEKISMLSGRLTIFLCFYWLKMEAFVHGWGGVALIHYISWKCRKPMTMLIGISVVLVLKSKFGAVFLFGECSLLVCSDLKDRHKRIHIPLSLNAGYEGIHWNIYENGS